MARARKHDGGGDALEGLAAATISTADFAKLVGVTTAAVGLRVSAGFIPRAGHGKLNLVEAVQGFIRYEIELAAKAQARAASSGRANLHAAKAAQIEGRLARQMRDLIERQEAEHAISEIVAISAKHMRDFAQRLPSELPRDEVAAEIGASCARLEKARDVLIGALRSGDVEGAKP
jgi:hypothetical protein